MTDAVALTQALIRCRSITPLDAGAQDILIRELETLGFTCTKLKFGNIENFFARRGTAGPHISFAGHTDVVPPGREEDWTHPPFAAEIADNKIYGRGTADMKANIAAFVAAVSEFKSDKGSISLIITGDEEAEAIDGTVKILQWMKDNDQIPHACLVGEPSNPNQMGDEIKIGRRGSLSGVLTVTGIQGHVAYPHLADNPIPHLARLIDALARVEWDKGSVHFGPSTLQFTSITPHDTAGNVIPGHAGAKFNIRFNDNWTAKTLEAEIRKVLDSAGVAYTLVARSDADSFITKPGPFTIIVADAVQAITDRTPALATGGGTSDARFIQQYCPVVECGLINKTIHKVDEHVAIDDLRTLQSIYAEILKRFLI